MDYFQSFGASGVRWWWTFRPLLSRRFNQWPQSHWLNPSRSLRTATSLHRSPCRTGHRKNRKPPMPNPLPKMNRINPPMTAGQRRAWLALEEQKRRRARAAALAAPADPVPAIVLASDGHGHLTWTVNFTSSYDSINIYKSDDGVTWPSHTYDGWDLSAGNRDCSGDPGYFRICVCDWDGNDLPPYSNAVYSDGL